MAHIQCCVPNVQQGALLSQNITITPNDHTVLEIIVKLKYINRTKNTSICRPKTKLKADVVYSA